MKKKTVIATRKYDTDILMKNLYFTLTRDFRALLGNDYAVRPELALKQGITDFRAYKFPTRSTANPAIFKRDYQLESLFKRYRFKDDVYTDEELEFNTYSKFFSHQEQLGRNLGKQYRTSTLRVLKRARQIISKILGDYNLEEHLDSCRFGKRACKGTPARNSYIDCKLENATGSLEHLVWFYKTYLPTDNLLRGLVESAQKSANPQVCTDLDMVNVDKNWKIKRGIVPNTLIGSFHSYGLGAVISDRLMEEGLNITTLQKKHRRLAKRYSRTRKHVTADVSNASNSFTYPMLARLLPRRWLREVTRGRIPYIHVKGGPFDGYHRIQSYMLMGIGYTFPLQTLLFYGLITAIGQLLHVSDLKVSVYGDDLIYPSKLHQYVTEVFDDLGIQLNPDKTYEKDYFRESCGGDYFHGTDVRPFSYQGDHQLLHRVPFVITLYKMINGLLHRWKFKEISSTIIYLIRLISSIEGIVVRVPSSFPDYSGIKLVNTSTFPWGLDNSPWYIPWSEIHEHPYTTIGFDQPCGLTYSWAYYEQHGDRAVLSEAIYYWDKLRSSHKQETASLYDGPSESIIKYVAYKPQKYCRSKITGRRIKRKYAVVARKGKEQVKFIRQNKSVIF